MQNVKTIQILNIVAFLAMVVVNALAVILPLNGQTPGGISDQLPNLFVPAGYAFSIWSVIYSLLMIFLAIQARSLFSSKMTPHYILSIGWLFILTCILNLSWIVSWHYLMFGLSVLVMVNLLLTLIKIYVSLQSDRTVPFMVRLPFSIYLGWITVATVANITAFLVSINWDGFGISPVIWTIVMLSIATLVGITVLWTRRDFAYVAVIVWALGAILSKRQAVGTPEEASIITVIYTCLGVILAVSLARFFVKTSQ